MKCDESKPVCGNCRKAGYTECKYRDEFERAWRYQTDKTFEKVREKQRELAEPRVIDTKVSTTLPLNGRQWHVFIKPGKGTQHADPNCV